MKIHLEKSDRFYYQWARHILMKNHSTNIFERRRHRMSFETLEDVTAWYQSSGVADWKHGDLPFDEEECIEHIWRQAEGPADAMIALRGYLVSLGANMSQYGF